MVGAEERWRELRAQGAQIDAAARAAPGRRHLEAVPEATSAAKKPLRLVWVVSSSYSITVAGLKQVLEGKAEVHIGGESCAGSPSCVVLYAGGGMEESCLDAIGGIRALYPGVPLLVFGSQLDLALAWATLKNGADGFVHAQMDPAQVLRAVEVVQKGELAAPRQLLGYLLSHLGYLLRVPHALEAAHCNVHSFMLPPLERGRDPRWPRLAFINVPSVRG